MALKANGTVVITRHGDVRRLRRHPIPGDYNGDGKTDIAVFRPSTGTWYISLSGGGTTLVNRGASGDVPIGQPPGT